MGGNKRENKENLEVFSMLAGLPDRRNGGRKSGSIELTQRIVDPYPEKGDGEENQKLRERQKSRGRTVIRTILQERDCMLYDNRKESGDVREWQGNCRSYDAKGWQKRFTLAGKGNYN